MATGYLSPLYGSGEQVFDSQGLILASGSITTYLAGTTTPAATYSDVGISVANENPIPLNSAGRPSTALGVPVQIWFNPNTIYKFLIKNSAGVTVQTWDNLYGIASGSPSFLGTIGVGGATPSTSGAGITFPAVQNPSTDLNTLDDYEEGTWVPSLGGNTTYTLQNGIYVKIGRLVHIRGQITVNVLGTGSPFTITGLPFSAIATSTVTVGYFTSAAMSLYFVSGVVTAGTIVLSGLTAAAANITFPLSVMGNSTDLIFSACYYATA